MAATLDMNDENWVNNPFVLGQRVRAKRKALGLTQADLSEKSGVTSRHISDIENGLKNVGAYTLF
ncbi:MAG: helix-turn-helix domain-containing protein, partial [Mariprofundaceae bacterium]|nr:helix-turn-helix domain-containing protein [Mariprofundaceae bacterium]